MYNVIYIKITLESSSKPRNCANSANRSTTLRGSGGRFNDWFVKRAVEFIIFVQFVVIISDLTHIFRLLGWRLTVLRPRSSLPQYLNLGSDVFAPSWCVTVNVPCKLISIVIYCRTFNTIYQTISHLSA